MTIAGLSVSGTRAKARRRAETAAATGLALAVHAAILVGMLFKLSPDHQLAGGAPAIQLTIGFSSDLAPAQPAPRAESSLFEEISRQLPPVPSTLSEPTRAKRTSLSELLGQGEAKSQSTAQQRTAAADALARSVQANASTGDLGVQASLPRQGRAGDGPCWSRPAQPLPVRMMVVVNERGMVIGMPQIIRGSARGAPQSEAEVQAMRALAGCAPFSAAPGAGTFTSYEFDFSKTRDWIRTVSVREVR